VREHERPEIAPFVCNWNYSSVEPIASGTRPKSDGCSMSESSQARRISRSKAAQRAESLEQILDAAEYLFSKNGFSGVTLRDVAERVGIHTTLLHYYFKDKRNLFEAVFKRRAAVTSGRRMAALEKYEAEAGDHPTVEGALHAFLDTDLDLYMEGGEPWMNYAAFCARVSLTPEGAEQMDVHFDPVVLKLIGILRRALPHYGDEDIFWGYQFVTGALMNALARTGRIDRLSGGLCRSDDFAAVKKRIAKFMASGFLSLGSDGAQSLDGQN
jgi:AcrR family transcriptional regulator